jgi:hypothetical protein
MGVFRKIGKGIGTVGGGVIGGTVIVAGKAVSTKLKGTGEWIEEVGKNVQSASKTALDNAGQFLDGAVQISYGTIKKDDNYKQKGLNDLKESTGKTVKGMGAAFKYTVSNAGTTFKGFTSGDKEQVIKGLKNLGKIVVVSGLAIGIVDVLAGADIADAEELETRNDHLNGEVHPETGVPYVEKTVELPNGELKEGTFPVFESGFNVVIAEDLYLESDEVHFEVANQTLYHAIAEDPNLANELGLSPSDVQALANGETPEGFTWHHNEQPGVLQLVDEETHAQTAHTGGRSIWGGGSDNR